MIDQKQIEADLELLRREVEKWKAACYQRGAKLRRIRKEARDYKKWKDFNTFMELRERIRKLEGEIERLSKLHEPKADTYACQRCGRRDGLDAVIPNQHWATITEGTLLTVEVVDGRWNLLCLWCIDELCNQHGIECSSSLHFCGVAVYGGSDSDANREHVSRLAEEIAQMRALLVECQPIVRATGHTAECMDAWDDRPGLQVCTCHISPLRSGIAAILKENHDVT